MQGTIAGCTLAAPRSEGDALAMLRDDPGLTAIAGCTDLYVALNFGTLRDRRFLDLWRLDRLRAIEIRDGRLWIGALATYTSIMRSTIVRRRLPMLAAAAAEIGGVQIQNRGTIGGNVANASPAGDTLPVLAAAEAIVHLESAADRRRVPLTAFYTGYRQSVRRADELIVGFEIPPVRGWQAFRKVGTRAAQAISKVVMAAVIGDEPRVAVGSVAPTVLRLRRTESIIAAGGTVAEAQAALLDEITPIDDIRSTAAYRRRVAANLLARMLEGGHVQRTKR
jgi:CO/xanthine dehydrogenase FAD-binding subunit